MSNVVKKINISDELYALKIKNPVFNSYYAPHYRSTNRYEHGDPVVTSFLSDNDNKTSTGTYLLLDTTGRYFHDIMENIPLIVALLNAKETFTVALIAHGLVDKTTGLFTGMTNDPSDIGSGIFTQPCEYLLDFFKYFNISYVCISHEDLIDFSCDYSYIFYQKSHASTKEEFIKNHEKYRSEPDFDVELKLSAKTWPGHNYPILARNSELLEYKVPDELEPEDGYFLRSNSWFYGHEYYLESIRLIRDYFPKYSVQKDKKIFLSRRNYSDRKVNSENLLENYFEKHGYEIVFLENYTPAEQLKLMQESERIAGMIGSAFLNTVVCGPENKILIFKPFGEYELSLFSESYNLYKIPYEILDVENDSEYIIKYIEKLNVSI